MAVFIEKGLATTSWSGNNNTNLIGTAVAHKEAVLSIDAPLFDTTAFAASLQSRTFITGLRSATASLRGRWNPAYNCSNITISQAGSGLYLSNLRKFSLNFAWNVEDVTVATGSALTSRAYLPGLLTLSGTYEAFVDDTTALKLPGLTTTDTATFTIVGESSPAQTVACSIVTSQLTNTMQVGSRVVAVYSFTASGDATAAGDADASGTYPNTPFKYWIDSASGIIGTPVTGTLVLTATSGRTYTGSAFPSAISIEAEVGQELAVSVNAQYTGAITVA